MLRLLGREGWWHPNEPEAGANPACMTTIIPDGPNLRWGTDAIMAWTQVDGWVWVFVCVDHYTAEAWTHVVKVGDRFVDELRQAIAGFVDRYNTAWLIQRHGHQTPKEAYQAAQAAAAA